MYLYTYNFAKKLSSLYDKRGQSDTLRKVIVRTKYLTDLKAKILYGNWN